MRSFRFWKAGFKSDASKFLTLRAAYKMVELDTGPGSHIPLLLKPHADFENKLQEIGEGDFLRKHHVNRIGEK